MCGFDIPCIITYLIDSLTLFFVSYVAYVFLTAADNER